MEYCLLVALKFYPRHANQPTDIINAKVYKNLFGCLLVILSWKNWRMDFNETLQ